LELEDLAEAEDLMVPQVHHLNLHQTHL
jgi:hypothetical protein